MVNKIKNAFILIVFVACASPLWAQKPIQLSEKGLVDLFRKQSAAESKAAAMRDQAMLEESLLEERYTPYLYSEVRYTKSNESSLIAFQPNLSPTNQLNIGVRKNLMYGLAVSTEAFGQQVSTPDGSINDASQFGSRASLTVDLWRNFLGFLDRIGRQSAALQKERVRLQAELESGIVELELRKIFWSMIAVEESLKVSQDLIQSSEKQLGEAKRRQRDGVADRGEVARYQAQVESRIASRLNFEYQKELLQSALRQQIPQLNERDFVLSMPDFEAVEKQFQICTAKIMTTEKTPVDESSTLLILNKLSQEISLKEQEASRHDSSDLVLNVTLQQSHVDQGYSQALGDFPGDSKAGLVIGLSLNVPIGDRKEKSEQLRLASQRHHYEAQRLELESRLQSVFVQVRKSLMILNQALKTQSKQSVWLNQNMDETNKKFNQGRVDVSTLIMEQDQLFSSRLNEIELKKQLIHAMYDFFKVFNRHPCSLNHIE